MAQTQLIPEAVKSTILLQLRSSEASTLAAVALFLPQPVTVKTTICIGLSLFYFTLSVCQKNKQLLAASSFFFLRCARPFPHLIFSPFPLQETGS